MGSKTNDGRGGKDNPVGPGQYDTRGSIGSKGFGKLQNKGFGTTGHAGLGGNKEKVPGPGSYCYTNREEYDYNQVGFGTSVRKSSDKVGGLGPGQYNESKIGDFGKIDIKMKYRHGDSLA